MRARDRPLALLQLNDMLIVVLLWKLIAVTERMPAQAFKGVGGCFMRCRRIASFFWIQDEGTDVLASRLKLRIMRSCSSPPNLDSANIEDGIDEILQGIVQDSYQQGKRSKAWQNLLQLGLKIQSGKLLIVTVTIHKNSELGKPSIPTSSW